MSRVLCILALLCSIAHADEDDDVPDAELDQATLALNAHEYEKARDQLLAVYRRRQDPKILRLLGEAESRLGNATAAINYFERYLVAARDADQADIDSARAELKRLQLVAPPQQRYPYDPTLYSGPHLVKKYKMGPSNGMLASGILLMCTGNLAAQIGGAVQALTSDRDGATTRGGLMAIPFIGPLVAPAAGRNEPAWDVSWAILNSGAQITGLALVIAGARYKTKHAYWDTAKVTPLVGPGMVGVSGRF
jgi:hypothetical protein